jgi:DNA-binding transcriptional MerR regulator
MTIGEVLGQLRGEFPDITISKIRFLESEGLIEPARSPSGYRKFTGTDLERLRFILSTQRDQYLPLRVIKERLEAIDSTPHPAGALAARRAGRRPVPRTPVAAGGPAAPQGGHRRDDPVDVRLTRRQLLDATGLTAERLEELEEYGLIRRNGGHYDGDALAVARTALALRGFGLEPRHLRVVKAAADREVTLIEQAVDPLLRQRDPGAHARAEETAREIAMLSTGLHAALVAVGLREGFNG